MRIALLATPGPLRVTLTTLLRAIVDTQGHARDVLLDDDDATRNFLADPPAGPLVIHSCFPRPALIKWLAGSGMPALIAIDPLGPMLRLQMSLLGQGPIESFRPIVQSLAVLIGSRDLPRRAVIRPQHLGTSMLPLAITLARVLAGPDRAEQAAEAALARLGWRPYDSVMAAIEAQVPDGVAPAIGHEAQALVQTIYAPMTAMLAGDEDPEIIWPPAFFFDGTLHVELAPTMVDLLGPARCLYYGPYLHLPVGRYEAALTIGLSPDVAGTEFRLDHFTDRVEAEFRAVAHTGGMFELPFDLVVRDALPPIQLRLFMEHGEIEGRIGLLRVRLQRLPSEPIEASELGQSGLAEDATP